MSKILSEHQVSVIKDALDSAARGIDELSQRLVSCQAALKEQIQENYILLMQLHQIDIERMSK